MNLTDEYKLSVYKDIKLLKDSDICSVRLAVSSVDGKHYIKKVYADNKAQVFSALQKIKSHYLPGIKEIIGGRTVIEEYVEGETLEQKLANGSLTEKQAKTVFRNVLSALDELHKNGIVHRDVKPSNIIIRPNGTAVLIDFGISKLFNAAADKDTSLMGTVGYAPPEQFGFAPTDYRSDIYAFGATAERLGVQGYSKIISKCKAFDPASRYANAGCVIAAIRNRFIGRIAASAAAVLLAAVLCVLFKAAIESKPEKQKENAQSQSAERVFEKETESQAFVQTAPFIIPSAVPETTQETVTFSTNRRLQLFDHSKPYRVIETDEHIYSILIMDTEADEKIIVPLNDETDIEVHYVLDRNVLKLNMTDGRHELEAEFAAAPITMGEHLTKLVMAEIVFYDITGDGMFEILPMFCHSEFTAVDGKLTKLVNSWEGYCIIYSPESGFSQCEGEIRVLGSESESVFFSGGEISSGNGKYKYVVLNNKIIKQ